MARRRARSLASEMAAVSMASPLVIAQRLYRLSQPGALASTRGQREVMRMGSEKVAATMEGASAMMFEALAIQQRLWWSAWAQAWRAWALPATGHRARAPNLFDLGMGMAAAGLAPYRRRAVGNRRRLARRRL